LQRNPEDPNDAQHDHHVSSLVLQIMMLGFFLANLILTGWPEFVNKKLALQDAIGLSDLVILLPFLITMFMIWVVQYPADRAIRQLALNPRFSYSQSVHPVWTQSQYLVFNIRHQLLTIAVPMAIIIVGDDILDQYRKPLRDAAIL